jgi:hypothetical protein
MAQQLKAAEADAKAYQPKKPRRTRPRKIASSLARLAMTSFETSAQG